MKPAFSEMGLVLAFCGFVGLQAISRRNRNCHMVMCRVAFDAAGQPLKELLTPTREDTNRRRWLFGRFYDIVNILLSERRVCLRGLGGRWTNGWR